jgi:hypothetical protein
MSSQEIFDTATAYSNHAPTEAVINIAQAAVRPTVDPTYMTILKELSVELDGHDNHEYEKVVFLFLKSMKSLLKNKGSALSFVLNTSLQAKFNMLNAIVTRATLTPSQLSRETGESPEYSMVSAMLAAGHVSMSSFGDYDKVTLHGLQQEMTRVNPIAGPFTPSVCEQLFNNTPVLTKPMHSSRTSSTCSTRQMSPPHRVSSSQTSQEPIHATKSASPAIDLLQVTPTQMRTPSITKHNNPSQQEPL